MQSIRISWISLETFGIVGFWEALDVDELLRREVNHRDMRKRTRTMAAPTQIPRTTHKCNPKMEVRRESWSFRNEYPDIVAIYFLSP